MASDEGRQTFTTSDGREIRRPRKRNAKLPDRYQQLVDGVLPIEDLDEEELYKGQLRNADGHIRGHHPKAIPWVMHRAYVDHVGKNVERTIINSMQDIIQGLIDIATDTTNDDSGIAMDVRVKAQTYLVDRILGRPTQKQEMDVQVHAKWEQAFQGGGLVVDLEDPDIIDAELVGEDHRTHSSPQTPALPGSGALVERPGEDARGREDEAVEESAPQAAPAQPRPATRPKTGVKLR